MSYCTKFGIYKNVTIMELLALQRFLNDVDTQWKEKTTTKNYHYYYFEKKKSKWILQMDICFKPNNCHGSLTLYKMACSDKLVKQKTLQTTCFIVSCVIIILYIT